MKDRERISNVEELLSDVLIRLDRMEDGQTRLIYGQSILHGAMTDLTKVVRINSNDIEEIKKTMCTKDDMARFAAAMMARFDAIDDRFAAADKRFDSVDKRFDSSDKRMDTMQGDINFIKEDLTTVKVDVNQLKSR